MAYINRLSDINNKLDINIENQEATNNKLTNIDDNIETLRTLTTNINTNINNIHDTTNNAINVNIVEGSISVSSVNIKDSSGNNLNSTSNALNSYITNVSIPVTGTFYQATQPISGTVSANIRDGSGTSITSTAVTTTKTGIDTAAALYVSNGTTRTALTATSAALDINLKTSTINRLNSVSAFSGAINTNTYSTAINIDGYNNAVISYNDTQNLTDAILIFASVDNVTYFYYGVLLPVYYSLLSKRVASTRIYLAPVAYIKLFNNSATNITTASCSIVSA